MCNSFPTLWFYLPVHLQITLNKPFVDSCTIKSVNTTGNIATVDEPMAWVWGGAICLIWPIEDRVYVQGKPAWKQSPGYANDSEVTHFNGSDGHYTQNFHAWVPRHFKANIWLHKWEIQILLTEKKKKKVEPAFLLSSQWCWELFKPSQPLKKNICHIKMCVLFNLNGNGPAWKKRKFCEK